MGNRQQVIFFLSSFILFFTGNGLHPLLPSFAGDFGASATTTGVFLASLSATNAAGALLASRLLARFSPRLLYVVSGALGVPALLALARVGSLWPVIVATGLVWFSGGFVMAVANVLTGLTVTPEKRGRAFSLLFLASPIASIFGGGALGAIISGWGYAPGFVVLAVMWAVVPLSGLKLAASAPVATAPVAGAPTAAGSAPLGRSFYLLLLSALTVAAAIHLRNVSAFMQMEAAGFSAAAISSTTVTAGLVTTPVALYAGSLSDRIGRRRLMLATTALVTLTLIPLAAASELWHFAAGIALLLAATAILRPAATAVATDLLPPAALQRGLPLVDAGAMGVGIVSAAAAGFMLERFGAAGVTALAVALLVVSGAALGALCIPQAVGAVCGRPALGKALRGRKALGQAA